MKSQKQAKTVNVLYTYKFNKINRICFTVLSSNEKEQYNTCFDKDENHGSCTCRGGDFHNCYHLDQLKARAAEYFASRQPAKVEQVLTAEDIADLVDPDIDATVKVDPVAEAEAFINRVVAEKAAKAEKLARGAALMESGKVSVKGYSGLHNSNEGHFEKHGDRLIPMR